MCSLRYFLEDNVYTMGILLLLLLLFFFFWGGGGLLKFQIFLGYA